MAINVPANGCLSVLVGDPGPNQSTPTPTTVAVGGVQTPVASLLELQSTTRALLLPRMTNAQIGGVSPVVDGMMIYGSDVSDLLVRKNGAWIQSSPIQGVQYATGTPLTAANINSMNGAPVQLLAAPGAGFMYVTHGFMLELVFAAAFTGGGNIYLQYGNTAGTGQCTNNIAATILTGGAGNQTSFAVGTFSNITALVSGNASICISNASAAFAGGGLSAVNWNIWYSIVAIS